MRPSKAEVEFKAKYPHAHTRPGDRNIFGRPLVQVFAGDYLCSEASSAKAAYRLALRWEQDGIIQPDPQEPRTELAR